jgi:hypothetical protein
LYGSDRNLDARNDLVALQLISDILLIAGNVGKYFALLTCVKLRPWGLA